MHRDPGDLHLAECRQHRPHALGGGAAHRAGDDDYLGPVELPLNGFPQLLGIVVDDPHPVHLGAGIAARRGQRVGVDVVDLTVARGTRDVDEFAADTHHRQPRPRVHQHPFASDRGQQPDLGRRR